MVERIGGSEKLVTGFNQIIQEQSYLEALNTEVGSFFVEALQGDGLTVGDIAALAGSRTDAVSQTKAAYMMLAASAAVDLGAIYFFGATGGLRSPRSFGLSAGSTTETVTLFRAVSKAEYAQILKSGRFQAAPSGAEGKYFAETAAHAARWGEALMGQGNFRIVKAQFPRQAADQFFRFDKLDGIGSARFARMNQLTNYTIFPVP